MTESNEKTRTNIYIDKATLQTFQEICKREGDKVSRKIEAFMQQHNQAHSLGNPQLKISVYARPEEPQPMRVLCLFLDGAVSDGKVHCKRAGMWIPGVRCYSCDKNQLRKKP
ncbi:MAG: hypothetical protein NWE94_01810 [Candidatus Bathyarchaeota archaeon]|nr:hypothetical protein [Candidatus Bathyarchaeota archaeon]